jgi:O-antigen ligase
LRVYKAAEAAGEGRWAMVLSNRRAPWSAAWEMVRERPLVGFGPGTFGAEYLPMRLRAELRARTRFLVPGVPVSSYSETHCEYLQAAAEAGLPAAAAASLAAALLGLGLLEAARRQGACRVEALVLLSLLAAGAVSAATWFPLQKTFTALPLLIAAGRAFRLAGGAPPTEAAA